MALNISPLLGAFLLLLLVTIPITVESKNHTKPRERGFNFLKHLEGCHKGQTVKGLHELKRYLEKFGYLHYDTDHRDSNITASNLNHANDDEFDNLLESAVKTYQSRYHLKVTGTLDSETIHKMIQPRCGVPDIFNAKHSKHPKVFDMVENYNFMGPKWPPTRLRLTYSFLSSAPVVSVQELRSVCVRAFKRWQDVSVFTFTEAPQGRNGDIVIGFHRGNHGDGAAFDGPSGTLAHAFAPTRGWFHYDADENWSTNPARNQIDLESVAVHEIGHVLGLAHSRDPSAIMYEAYRGIRRVLQPDDIQGIRALYSS